MQTESMELGVGGNGEGLPNVGRVLTTPEADRKGAGVCGFLEPSQSTG